MKLKKIYIAAFGGLKDFTLTLGDGLNVIYGNNEDGKSTVFAFIKAMFYGTGRNTKSISDSMRLKYTPWDGSAMAGRIFFEHKGKNYCLEKEFRKSDSTDKITLTDLDSGKAIDTNENIGQQFFGLSAAAFERSLFIGNGDFIKDDTAAGEINAKLSNIALTGSEDVSYKQIAKNIFDTRAKLISKSGRSGSYNEDLLSLENLNKRLVKADEDARLKSQLNDNAQLKRTEYEALYKRYTELKQLIEKEQDFKNSEKLTEFLETKRSLDELNQTLKLSDGTIVNETFAQKIEFCLNKYEKSSERCEQINTDIARIKEAINLQNNASPESTKEQLENLTHDANQLSQQKIKLEQNEVLFADEVEELKQKLTQAESKKSVVNPAILILSVVLAAAGGIVGYFVSPVAAAVLIVTAAILLTLSFIIRPKNTSGVNDIQTKLTEANSKLSDAKLQKNLLSEQINNINARINTLSSVLQADNTIKQQRLVDLEQKCQELNEENTKLQNAKLELLNLLCAFEPSANVDNAKSVLLDIKQKTEKQKEIKLQLKTASQFLGNIDYTDAEQKLNEMQHSHNMETVDFEAVKSEFDAVSEKLSTLKDTLTAIMTELKTSFKTSENPEELKRETAALQEKINSKKAFCDAADLAISVLEESFYELRRGYGSELEKATHDIFANLTLGKYKSVNITDTLDLSVEKSDVFGTHELDYLSLGTTHQAYLSLRLAIASLISDDCPLPIFLDDSLSQYDDTRTERAITFLKDFCKDGQGVLFTCHNSVCQTAKTNGIVIQKPYN